MMASFELLERDGFARLGRLTTPHGTIETPALLPVIHPDPSRQSWSPRELARRLGVRGVISSAYIAWRTPDLRATAERSGIHGLLDFEGAVMTDSGAFQEHAYGSVEVPPEEIVAFQERIGSDIATVLDRFTEPDTPREEAEEALRITHARAVAARGARRGLLAVPVQGGLDPDLRARAAAQASSLADVLAVGGVVPLFEQYRFVDLAHVLIAVRPHLVPEAAVHLFGAGHPMVFAFAALFGVDLFDSSAYHKFARRGRLLFPEGTVALDDLREKVCGCALCEEHPLVEVAGWAPPEREAHLSLHNLASSLREVARVRQAIRDGTLWELVERRALAHPALRAGLRAATQAPQLFAATEPASRRAFREIGPDSLRRPSVDRFSRRLAVFLASRSNARRLPRVALRPEYLRRLPAEDRSGRPITWLCATPLGAVPLELTELYPVGPYLGLDEYETRNGSVLPSALSEHLAQLPSLEADLERDWTESWTRRQIVALLEWQFGRAAADRLSEALRGDRSRRTGRLRVLRLGERPAFVLGDDAIPRPTFHGAGALQRTVPPGRWRVTVAEEAVEFARAGRSVFSKFVLSADPALVPGSSALVVDGADNLLGVGRLLLAPHEMGRLKRGLAVRMTSHARAPHAQDEGADEEPGGPFSDAG